MRIDHDWCDGHGDTEQRQYQDYSLNLRGFLLAAGKRRDFYCASIRPKDVVHVRVNLTFEKIWESMPNG